MRRPVVFALLSVFVLPVPGFADLTIHCLDIGQGDATLIVSSSGQTFLFDGGAEQKGFAIINPYLTSLGITDLTYMGASHFHSDHIGGLDEVYWITGVTTACYDRGWSYSSPSYDGYALAVGAIRETFYDGQTIDLGDGVTIRCAGLNGNGVLLPPFEGGDENAYSVALVVSCGAFDFYVGGDVPGSIELSLGPDVGEVEVYQANHHSSRNSTTEPFIAALSPEVSVFSLGDNNGYGYPHQETINRLAAAGCYIYQTNLGEGGTLPPGGGRVVDGHVVIQTDGISSYTADGDFYPLDATRVCRSDRGAATPVSLLITPNPCSPATVLRYSSPSSDGSRVAIYDVRGREVLHWAVAGAGELLWNGTDAHGSLVAGGVYFCRMMGGTNCITQKIILAR